MDRGSLGLVHDPVLLLPQSNAIVGVFVVPRPVSFVEPAERCKHLPPGQKQGGGTEVDIALHLEFGRARILATSVTITEAIRPDDRSRFLQAAVRVNELAAHGSNRV